MCRPTRFLHGFLMAFGLASGALLASPGVCAYGTATAPPAEISPGMLLFAGRDGNVLLHVGARESLVVGALTPDGTASVRRYLAAHRAPAVRYALAADGPDAAVHGDGGWGRAGATTIAHEHLRTRMSAALEEASRSGNTAPVALPALGFSAVQQVYLADDQVHAVYQESGPGNADVSVHFEGSNVLFLGTLLTTDGFPELDLEDGGSMDGLIRTVDFFARGFADEPRMRFVPGRGPCIDGAGLKEYLQMLQSARALVQARIEAGLDEEAIASEDPLQALDARWGRARVSTRAFTLGVARSLRRK